jgi:hypothetical protein
MHAYATSSHSVHRGTIIELEVIDLYEGQLDLVFKVEQDEI